MIEGEGGGTSAVIRSLCLSLNRRWNTNSTRLFYRYRPYPTLQIQLAACSRSRRHRCSTTSVASSSVLSGCALSASLAASSRAVE
jgi:hypothetical protein